MQLLISDKYNEEFIYNYLYKVIYELVSEEYSRYTQMRTMPTIIKYVYDTYKIKISEVIKAASDNLLISKVGSSYIITVNKTIIINNSNLLTLVSLIDNGTLEHRGLNIFKKTFAYVQSNIDTIYRSFIVLGGELNVS